MYNKQKRKEEKTKMKKVDAKSLEAVHTHTHTHTHSAAHTHGQPILETIPRKYTSGQLLRLRGSAPPGSPSQERAPREHRPAVVRNHGGGGRGQRLRRLTPTGSRQA